VNIDTGTLRLDLPLLISGAEDLGLGLDEGFTLQGPGNPDYTAELFLANPDPDRYDEAVVELNNAIT